MKMKRPKRAQPTIDREYMVKEKRIQCPHCKTYLVGGYSEDTMRMRCYQCKNPIDINWPWVIEARKQGAEE